MNVLTIDIGGTFIKYALMDEESRFLSRGKVPTPQEGREQLVETIGKLYDEAKKVDGIAISMPGIIDSENCYCKMGGALRYNDDFYLRHRLYERCPVKICMENDAKCAAMADQETVWGNRCGTPHLCALFAEKKGLPAEEVDGIRVFEAINAGDQDAVDCLQQFTKEVAIQIFNLQTVLDPGRFAIGGGISAQPVFIESIKNHLKALYAACPYDVPHADVVTCKFQNDANLVGALQCFLSA